MTDVIAATADAPLADDFPNPFRGLASYREEDADRFFGRAGECRILVGHLRTARLTILYAESGVGKSSLIRAGVTATLDRDSRRSIAKRGIPEFVPVIFNDWRRDPVADLMGAIEAKADEYAKVIAEASSRGRAGLGRRHDPAAHPEPGPGLSDIDSPADHDAVTSTQAVEPDLTRTITAATKTLDATVDVILDQFEDLFSNREHVEGFADALAACVNDPSVRANFLIAVREDAFGKLGDLLRGRVRNVYGNYFHLKYLTRGAAREAIEGPVREPVTVGEGLTDTVLDEVRTDYLQLGSHRQSTPATDGSRASSDEIEAPFLQLVMERLWDRERDKWRRRPDEPKVLRKSTLQNELGGAQTIVAEHFDLVLGGLEPEQRTVATKLLADLVTPSGMRIALTTSDLAAKAHGSAAKACESEPDTAAILSALERQRIVRQVDPAPGHTENRWELFHDRLARPIQNWGNEQARLRLAEEVQRRAREARRLELRSRRLLCALVALSAIVLTLVGYLLRAGPLNRLESRTVDTRFSVRGTQHSDRNIVLVTADSLVPRAVISRAFDQLRNAGARAIACDVYFQDAKKGDAAILAAVQRAGPRLVLATETLNDSAETELFGTHVFPEPAGGPAVGYAPLPGDSSAAVLRNMDRSVSLQAGPDSAGTGMYTLGVATALAAGVPKSSLDALPSRTWIDYRGGAGTFPRISFSDVVTGRPATLAGLRGKIVVFGITIPSVDVHDTSAPGPSRMFGVEIQANAISTALRGFPLRNAGAAVDAALIVLLGLIPFLLALRFNAPMYVAGVAATAALFCLVAQVAFDAGRVVNVVFPLACLVISAAGVLAVLLSRQSRQRVRRDSSADLETVQQTAGRPRGPAQPTS